MKNKLLILTIIFCGILLFIENTELSAAKYELEVQNEQQIEYVDTIEEKLEQIPNLEEEVQNLTDKNNSLEEENSVFEEKNNDLEENFSISEKENTELEIENSTLQSENAILKKENDALKANQSYSYSYCNESFKSYTDYHCLSRTSKQWELQEQAYTDENGLRKIDDCYLVALGSYYGRTLGTKYIVTLSSGNTFKIILCDQKSDKHTDSEHKYSVSNGCMIEFYVDTAIMPEDIRSSGNIGKIPFFSGEVVSIEKIN